MGRGFGGGRPKRARRVALDISADYFKPAGIPMSGLDSVVLSVEEAEAIRLVDLEHMEQEDAAKEMGVSRRTLARDLRSARGKVADALINGKSIKIEGGNYKMVGRGREGGYSLGPGGDCTCPSCGYRESHGRGDPCYKKTCPKCGAKMTRS